MSVAYLKIKVKSLAAEAGIIRHDERRWLKSERWLRKHPERQDGLNMTVAHNTWSGLNTHRLNLRIEQRATFIAYGYLLGRSYREIEKFPCYLKAPFCRPGPDWGRVRDLVWKYGPFHPAGNKEETEKGKKALWDKLVAWCSLPLAKAA